MVTEQAAMLAAYVRQAIARVGLPDDAVVVLAGGVFRHRSSDFADAIADDLADFELRHALVEPVYGAVLTAADLIGASPDVERLASSGPDPSFFRTL